jgi:hypothetical protein
MNTKDETKYPVIRVDAALEELPMAALQMEAARAALIAVQKALEPSKKWRASSLWETVQEAQDLLDQGEFYAWCHPTKPENFRHWREKYITAKDAARSDYSLHGAVKSDDSRHERGRDPAWTGSLKTTRAT